MTRLHTTRFSYQINLLSRNRPMISSESELRFKVTSKEKTDRTLCVDTHLRNTSPFIFFCKPDWIRGFFNHTSIKQQTLSTYYFKCVTSSKNLNPIQPTQILKAKPLPLAQWSCVVSPAVLSCSNVLWIWNVFFLSPCS